MNVCIKCFLGLNTNFLSVSIANLSIVNYRYHFSSWFLVFLSFFPFFFECVARVLVKTVFPHTLLNLHRLTTRLYFLASAFFLKQNTYGSCEMYINLWQSCRKDISCGLVFFVVLKCGYLCECVIDFLPLKRVILIWKVKVNWYDFLVVFAKNISTFFFKLSPAGD